MTDEERIRDLYSGRYRVLVGQLVGVTGSVSAAEEAVQEAFVAALTHPRQFAALDRPEAWLRTVAVNHARSRFRRSALWRTLMPSLVPTASSGELSPDHLAVVAALRHLPVSQRECLALHYLADLPLAEVAESVGAPVGTVKSRLSRGRAALADLLSVRADDEEARHA